MMPGDNLETARRFMELGRSGDLQRLELLAENVVYRPIAEITEAGEFRGRQGYSHYMDAFFGSDWAQGLEFEATSYRSYGDAVVVRIELSGRGRASGIDFAARVFQVLMMSGGEIVRIEDFLDRDEAVRTARAFQGRSSHGPARVSGT